MRNLKPGIMFLKIITIFGLINLSLAINDRFDEELVISPLPSGHIYTYFQFTTRWEADLSEAHHCHLFPHAVAEILYKLEVQELHISMTQGLWRHEHWGYPIIDAPPGAEIWAWFNSNASGRIDENWKRLTNALSGLLCTSFNFIDQTNTVTPEFSFRPEGVVDLNEFNSSNIRFAALPREVVCTENLTPWLKLLPCNSKKGFASLLNAANIYNTRYHSLGLVVRPICTDKTCKRISLENRQTVSLVYDPLLLQAKRDWSFRYLFGQGLINLCSLAKSTKVYVDLTHNFTNTYKLSPEPFEHVISTRGGVTRTYGVYDLIKNKPKGPFSIASKLVEDPIIIPNMPPPIHASRYLTGYGQEYGGLTTRIHNNQWSPLNVVILEHIPWFVELYLHTLYIECSNGQILKPEHIRYVPGIARDRPYYLELAVKLPARSITTVSISLNYNFLKWQEYPPDANHGFYMSAATITTMLPLAKNYTGLNLQNARSLFADSFNVSTKEYPLRIYTEIILVTLPTPDFSMPYNVVCLACTVVALAFGPLHNITTKRLQKKATTKAKKSFKDKIKEKLFGLLGKNTNIPKDN